MRVAYGLLQMATDSEGLGVYVQDVRDSVFVHECPLSTLLKAIGEQLYGIVEENCPPVPNADTN